MSTLAMQTSNKIETVVSFFNTDFFTTKTEKGREKKPITQAFLLLHQKFTSIGVALIAQFSLLRGQILIHSLLKRKMGKHQLGRVMQIANYNFVLAI